MIVRGEDRADMLLMNAGISKSDKLVFITGTRRNYWHLLTTDNGRVGLDIGPDKNIDVANCE